MKIRIIPVAAGLAGATALAITGAALANADPATTATTTTAAVAASDSATPSPQPPSGNGNTDPSKPMRSDERLLTGTTAQKVTAAAKTKEPGATIQRVETDSDGVYEAHMVRSDGTPITVKVGKDFAVTGVIEGGGPGGGRPGAGARPSGSSSGTTPSST